nr:integrase, catalytic region, zinc finger, CCHC-type, peptidase aspartic, catalytic [Tanacetum cinerariifolium]
MSTQKDIYAAGSKSHPLMLNKENYVPWLSRLLWYAKSRPNGKQIYNSILNDDELSDKKLKQIEADDQAIQTILLGLPEDIYAVVNSCETAQEIWLRVQQMMKGSDIGIQEKKSKLFNEWGRFTSNEGELIESYYHRFLKLMNDLKINKHFPEKIASNLKCLNNLQLEWSRHRISSNPRNRQIAQLGINMGQDRQIHMVGGNGGNQFRQYAGQNAENPAGYNDVIGNQIGNGNLMAARAEGNAAGQNGNQIRCYNCRGVGHYARNCTIRPKRKDADYLQTQLLIAQKEEAGIQLQAEDVEQSGETVEQHPEAAKFVGDLKSLTNEADASLAKHKALEFEIERLLKAICDECKYEKILYDKAYKDMQQKIKRLQAQLGDLKGKSKDTLCVSDTRNPLSQKLESENVELEFQVLNYARENAHLKATYKNLFDSIYVSHAQTKTIIASLQNELQSTIYKNAKLRTQLFKKVSNQKDNTQNSSENTKFAKKLIMEKLTKVGETNALSKPVTSNSVSTPQESKGVNNDKLIAPGMFRINLVKTSRDEKHVPNIVRASNKTTPITVSQPPVFTKKDMNSDLNENQMKYQPKGAKLKKVESHKSLAIPKPRKSRLLLRWSPTGRLFDQEGKIVDSSEFDSQSDCVNGDNARCSKHMTGNLKLLINFVWKFIGAVRFENDHVAAILDFGDLK